MARLGVGLALLFAAINVSLPLHAQSVSLLVCNAGKVEIDVFLSQAGKVASSHIGSADCAAVGESAGAMQPGLVGFAFADSRGQWAGARRFDLLPDLGLNVLSTANQSVPVRHGNANIPLPMLVAFRPRVPECNTYGGNAAANLPLNATPAQRNAAAITDANNPRSTVCQTLVYTLNVEAFPETREVSFKLECDVCDKKREAQLTPEERAARQRQDQAANQVISTLSGLGPLGGVFSASINRDRQEAEEERKSRESRLSPTQRVKWSDLLPALRRITRSQMLWDVIPRNIIIRGTVSSVEVSQDAFEPAVQWVNIAFRESPTTDFGPNRRPYSEFNVCTSNPAILQDLFGAAFLTSMIGKTIEVEGETQSGGDCRGLLGAIRITLAGQIRPVSSAQFATGTPVWTPPK